ncbi:hypothetical protein M514_04554 [Trichuris suis]|uniref:Uncharacterized protein n=1 Tax=Trichuris suis TaxID=68888 RepID=A0A085NIE6_9BILA|nr:hypothetical protein M513_04554 [Trichuris suis]KFD69242.1 hypothetical protein M514_04554 [Trichuris suis]
MASHKSGQRVSPDASLSEQQRTLEKVSSSNSLDERKQVGSYDYKAIERWEHFMPPFICGRKFTPPTKAAFWNLNHNASYADGC